MITNLLNSGILGTRERTESPLILVEPVIFTSGNASLFFFIAAFVCFLGPSSPSTRAFFLRPGFCFSVGCSGSSVSSSTNLLGCSLGTSGSSTNLFG